MAKKIGMVDESIEKMEIPIVQKTPFLVTTWLELITVPVMMVFILKTRFFNFHDRQIGTISTFRVTTGITAIGSVLILMNVSMNLTIVTKTQYVKILLVVFGVFVMKDTTSKMMAVTNVLITTSVSMVSTTMKLIT